MYSYYIDILSIQTSFDVNVSNKLSSGVARLQQKAVKVILYLFISYKYITICQPFEG